LILDKIIKVKVYKLYKIVFIGPISPPVTGPGVKNKELIDSFKRSDVQIVCINSLGWMKNPIPFFLNVISNVIKYKRVVLSISKKGRYVLLPLIYLMSNIFDIKYILLPAGGNLDKEIKNVSKLYKILFFNALKKSSGIYVESKSLKEGLINLGLTNIDYMPNPRRRLNFEWKIKTTKIKRIVFLSKIKEEKGVLILAEAAEVLNKNYKELEFHFYGPIEEKFKKKFTNIINKPYIFYGGIANPSDVQEVLSNADIFILPTMWKNEGLPGVLVEASFTGVPIIISRFRASEEFIQNNENGIIIEPGSSTAIVEAVKYLLENNIELRYLSENFKKLSNEFDVDKHTKKLLDDMQKNNWEIFSDKDK
jgi:glycosyltransferase involved in cell wall biosynthesis